MSDNPNKTPNEVQDVAAPAGPAQSNEKQARTASGSATAQAAGTAPGGNAGKAGDPGAPSDRTATLEAEVAKLQQQISDLTDRMLRAHAEMDNLRKRAEREKQETAKYAITKFARDTVEVADNFERALNAVPEEAAAQNDQLKALLEGVSMTEREFLKVLERHGVQRVSPKGEQFNPHFHQAVMERHDPSIASGTVVEVFQAGYVIDDRCLRPAMVVVARGGAKAQPNPKQETPPAADMDRQPASEDDAASAAAEAGPETPRHDSENGDAAA